MKTDTLHSAKFLRAHQRTNEPLVDDGEGGIVVRVPNKVKQINERLTIRQTSCRGRSSHLRASRSSIGRYRPLASRSDPIVRKALHQAIIESQPVSSELVFTHADTRWLSRGYRDLTLISKWQAIVYYFWVRELYKKTSNFIY